MWGPPCMSINCTGTAPRPGRDWTTHAFPRWAVCHRVCTSLGRGVCEGRKELPVAVLFMFLLPPHALSPLSCLPNAAGSQVTVAGAGGRQGHLAQRLGAGSGNWLVLGFPRRAGRGQGLSPLAGTEEEGGHCGRHAHASPRQPSLEDGSRPGFSGHRARGRPVCPGAVGATSVIP